jgi:hypothetical protein
MKSPPVQYSDDDAREMLEAFIHGDSPHVAVSTNGHSSALRLQDAVNLKE